MNTIYQVLRQNRGKMLYFYAFQDGIGGELVKDLYFLMELAWHSGSVMDCHAPARGSIPSGKGVKTELHVLRKGQ